MLKNLYKIYFLLFLSYSHPQLFFAQDSTTIKRHLSYLGSDLFEGRGTGTIGGELTAKYIALYLNKYELSPMGYENTFYQYVPMHGSISTDDSQIIIIGEDKDTLSIKKDFQYFHTGGRIFTPNPISVVFAGFGISAPEFEYDDYTEINVEGKVVIYFEGEPYFENSEYFNGTIPTNNSFSDSKQKTALSKGAVGTIQIPAFSCKSATDWEKLIQEYYFEDISLAYLPTPLLSVLLNPKSAAILFNDSQFKYDAVKQMCENQKLKSFELKTKILLDARFTRRDFVAPNVVGFLQGTDEILRNEFIVVSAHYDHLGIGLSVEGDSIYNGVLDNAIGVSALLELSKMLSENNSLLKRSIIFLFVTGEEKGLLGSTYFIDHPPIQESKIIANINVDGLAIIDEFKSVVGVGSELSSLGLILNKVAASNNLKVYNIPNEFDSYESFLHSDQLAFALAGIPSILISDGIDCVSFSKEEVVQKWKDYLRTKYHTPFDDLTQPINYTAVNQHIHFLYDFILETANASSKIEWMSTSPFQRRAN